MLLRPPLVWGMARSRVLLPGWVSGCRAADVHEFFMSVGEMGRISWPTCGGMVFMVGRVFFEVSEWVDSWWSEGMGVGGWSGGGDLAHSQNRPQQGKREWERVPHEEGYKADREGAKGHRGRGTTPPPSSPIYLQGYKRVQQRREGQDNNKHSTCVRVCVRVCVCVCVGVCGWFQFDCPLFKEKKGTRVPVHKCVLMCICEFLCLK